MTGADRKLATLGAAITLAALLASSSPSCGVSPSDEPAEPASAINEMIIVVESNPSGIYANITLNVHDHSGQPTVNLEVGELYPTNYARRTTYKHVVVSPATATGTYIVDAITSGEPGDLLGCSMILNGVKLTEPGTVAVYEIPSDLHSAHVYCEYTLTA